MINKKLKTIICGAILMIGTNQFMMGVTCSFSTYADAQNINCLQCPTGTRSVMGSTNKDDCMPQLSNVGFSSYKGSYINFKDSNGISRRYFCSGIPNTIPVDNTWDFDSHYPSYFANDIDKAGVLAWKSGWQGIAYPGMVQHFLDHGMEEGRIIRIRQPYNKNYYQCISSPVPASTATASAANASTSNVGIRKQ